MLRRRSKGVAQNSLHMQGKAMDFFIPDVPLSKLREIGLRMQLGGVGFYPTSGSPFVHMDTGSVRHWPRMTRQQLVRVFPNGNTLHVPSDGKPLPGYAKALAAYKARKAGLTSDTRVASFGDAPVITSGAKPAGKPMLLAAANPAADDNAEEADAAIVADATPAPAVDPKRTVGVAVASYATTTVPMPRLAPRLQRPMAVAAPAPPPASDAPRAPATTSPASRSDRWPRLTSTSAVPRTGRRRRFPPPSPPPWPNATRPAAARRCRSHRPRSSPRLTSTVRCAPRQSPRRCSAATIRPPHPPASPASSPTPRRRLPPRQPVRADTGGVPMPRLNPLRAVARAPLRRARDPAAAS